MFHEVFIDVFIDLAAVSGGLERAGAIERERERGGSERECIRVCAVGMVYMHIP